MATSSPRSVDTRMVSTSRWVNVAVAGRPVSGSAEATRSADGLILQEVLDDLFSHGSHETVLVGQGEVSDAADLVLQADVVQEVGVRPPGEVVDLGVLAQPGEDRGHEHGAEPAHGEHAQQPPGVGGHAVDVERGALYAHRLLRMLPINRLRPVLVPAAFAWLHEGEMMDYVSWCTFASLFDSLGLDEDLRRMADLALAHTDPDVRTAGKEIVEDFLQD